jgi:hypothetical protein
MLITAPDSRKNEIKLAEPFIIDVLSLSFLYGSLKTIKEKQCPTNGVLPFHETSAMSQRDTQLIK